jgi:Flp pilus assembly pilin Flp
MPARVGRLKSGSINMLQHAKSFALRLWRDEGGASLLEYTVLIGIVLAVSVALVTALGLWASDQWNNLCDKIGTACTSKKTS